jgi:hypothetical protein
VPCPAREMRRIRTGGAGLQACIKKNETIRDLACEGSEAAPLPNFAYGAPGALGWGNLKF